MASLLKAEHLSRYYGRYCAVNDVSFTLAEGEVLGGEWTAGILQKMVYAIARLETSN